MKLSGLQSGTLSEESQIGMVTGSIRRGECPYEIALRRSFEFQKNRLLLWSRFIDIPTKIADILH